MFDSMFLRPLRATAAPAAFVALLALSVAASAQESAGTEPAPGPHEIIAQRTDAVIAATIAAQDYYAEEPERFYATVLGLLEDVVDFRSFARNVMGEHASRKRLATLSPEERQHLGDYLQRFTGVFRDSLIKTYARALLTVADKEISLLPLSQPLRPQDRKAQVVQQVVGEDEPLVIKYSVRRNKAGRWLLSNLIVSDINLGKLYRNQFRSAMKKHKGDMDKVIANWTSGPGAPGSDA